jgi:hypothetical protein
VWNIVTVSIITLYNATIMTSKKDKKAIDAPMTISDGLHGAIQQGRLTPFSRVNVMVGRKTKDNPI